MSPDSKTSGLFSISSPNKSTFRADKGSRIDLVFNFFAFLIGSILPLRMPFKSATATWIVFADTFDILSPSIFV